MSVIDNLTILLTFFIGLSISTILDKIKYRQKIKYVRIISLDHDVKKTFLDRIENLLEKDNLTKHLTILKDAPICQDDDKCLFDSVKGGDRKDMKRILKRLKKIDCWLYEPLLKKMGKWMESEEFAFLAVTTKPISNGKAYFYGGTFDNANLKESGFEKITNWFRGYKAKIVVLAYRKKEMNENSAEMALHEMAHALGLQNYYLICDPLSADKSGDT